MRPSKAHWKVKVGLPVEHAASKKACGSASADTGGPWDLVTRRPVSEKKSQGRGNAGSQNTNLVQGIIPH